MAYERNGEIEKRLLQLSPREFQTLCNNLLFDQGYQCLSDIGNQSGGPFTAKGTPDSIFRCPQTNKLIYVEATIQKKSLFKKIKADIVKCEEQLSTIKSNQGLEPSAVDLFYFHIGKLSAEEIAAIEKEKKAKPFGIQLFDRVTIIDKLMRSSQWLLVDLMGEHILGNCVFSLDYYLKHKTSESIDRDMTIPFVGRSALKQTLQEAIKNNKVVLVKGASGVGKSRLAIEALKTFGRVLLYKPVDSRSLGFLEAVIETNVPTVVFVDDIDEVERVRDLVDLVNQRNCKHVSLVCTVRSYAFEGIKQCLPLDLKQETIDVPLATRQEAEEIVKGSFPKLSKQALDYVVENSKCNIRIALILSKMIDSNPDGFTGAKVAEIIFSFYKKRIEQTIGEKVERFFDSIALLAFCRKIVLTSFEPIQKEMAFFGVEREGLLSCVDFLRQCELMETPGGLFALFSDQGVKDFILFDYFVKRKRKSLKDAFAHLFSGRENEFALLCTELVSQYGSPESVDYVTSQLVEVWNLFGSDPENLGKFLARFYSIDHKRALMSCKSQLDLLGQGPLEEDFSLNISDGSRENDFVRVVANIAKEVPETRDEAVDILISTSKLKETFRSCLQAFQELLIIDQKSLNERCSLQSCVIKRLNLMPAGVLKDKLIVFACDKLLSFEYSHSWITPDGKMSLERLMVRSGDDIGSFRFEAWEAALNVSDEAKYDVLLAFSRHHPSEDAREVYIQDMECASKILASMHERVAFKDFALAIRYADEARESKRKWPLVDWGRQTEKALSLLTGDRHAVDYEEREKLFRMSVCDFFRNILPAELDALLKLLNGAVPYCGDHSWKINDLLSTAISVAPLERLSEIYQFSKKYPRLWTYTTIWSFAERAIDVCEDPHHFLASLQNEDLLESFFELQSRGKGGPVDAKQYDRYLKMVFSRKSKDSFLIEKSAEPWSLLPFVKARRTLAFVMKKRRSFPRKAASFLRSLFGQMHDYPLFDLFDQNHALPYLARLFFYLLREEKDPVPYESKILQRFSRSISGFLKDYVEYTFSNRKGAMGGMLTWVWEESDFERMMDEIMDGFMTAVGDFYHFYSSSLYREFASFRHGLDFNRFVSYAKKRMAKEDNETGQCCLLSLFNEFPDNVHLELIVAAIKAGIPRAVFEKVGVVPNHMSTTQGSFALSYERRIKHLEDIKNAIPQSLECQEYAALLDEWISDAKRAKTEEIAREHFRAYR